MHDELPAEVYIVRFAKMTGIFLETTETFAVTEKIYGKQTDKITKILNTFSNVDRNLGVLFSGTKGMGKSMSMRQLAKLAIEKDILFLLLIRILMVLLSFFRNSISLLLCFLTNLRKYSVQTTAMIRKAALKISYFHYLMVH